MVSVLTALLVLIVQNSQEVRFEWLWFDFHTSLAVMLLATVVVTLTSVSLGGLIWRLGRRTALEQESFRSPDHSHNATRTSKRRRLDLLRRLDERRSVSRCWHRAHPWSVRSESMAPEA